MTTENKRKLAELQLEIDTINGALDLAYKLIAKYTGAGNFSRANLTSDTIDALIEERAALMEERDSLYY